MPLRQRLVKGLHREGAVAFLVQAQHPRDLLDRCPPRVKPVAEGPRRDGLPIRRSTKPAGPSSRSRSRQRRNVRSDIPSISAASR
jgi:hypothetical protein